MLRWRIVVPTAVVAAKPMMIIKKLQERYGHIPGDFREELRRVILEELADRVGVDYFA